MKSKSEKRERVIVLTSDDKLFEKVSTELLQKRFVIDRAKDYDQALEKLNAKEYRHVVCNLTLTEKDSFNFIGKVKELPYNHSNFLLSIESFLYDQDQISVFEDFLGKPETRKELERVFNSSFAKMNVREPFVETESFLELSEKNKLPYEKTYLFDFTETEIFLGVRTPVPPKVYNNILIVIVRVKDKKEELALAGEYHETTSFDEDKERVSYLTFNIGEEDKERWKKYLDLFAKESLELKELITNTRGY